MSTITWDGTGDRLFETGTDHGVLYEPDDSGAYTKGVPWNGLTAVTESPSGAEASDMWADNMKYGSLRSTETFGATIEAYTCPKEFYKYDGSESLADGVYIGQQNRKAFGFSFRTLVGNDIKGQDYGYKLHLVYGVTANPSERSNATVNDSPEAMTLSWEVTTNPVSVSGFKPTATVTIDSTEVNPAKLKQLEDILYGTASAEPRMPLPDEVKTIFAGSTPAPSPTLGSLKVTAATREGGQTVTVDPANADSGNLRRYKITDSDAKPSVSYDAALTTSDGWVEFPDNGQVSGNDGQVCTVVEVTTNGAKARKKGDVVLPAPTSKA